MHSEAASEKPRENGEESAKSPAQGATATSELTASHKYRDLKTRLKYLIYVRSPSFGLGVCFYSPLNLGAQVFRVAAEQGAE